MATQAFSAYGSQVRLGDGTPLAALTITAATNATPIIVTTSSNHNVTDVSYAVVAGVGGNTAANGAWIVERVSNTQLKLRRSVGNGAYTSGGTLTLQSTFASIAELRNIQDVGSRANMEDVSAHDGSGYSSMLPSLKHTNAMRLDINYVPLDPTHNEDDGLMALYNSGASRHWLLVLPPPTVGGAKPTAHVYGFVQYYTFNLPVEGAVQAQVTLEFDGALTVTGS